MYVVIIFQELATCDPSYYKWTQYLFLLMYEKGFVYKKKVSFYSAIYTLGFMHLFSLFVNKTTH